MSVLPSPVQAKRSSSPSLVPVCFSLALILLLQSPPKPRSLFVAHESPSAYLRTRAYEPYPWGKVCSSPAREHFLTRFNRPHLPLGTARKPKSIDESFNRVFMSAVPHEVGDGLGHRTCILNYELHMALVLGLTYSHRVSGYGSLTREDPLAVETLFGWGRNELSRDYILEKGCLEVANVNDTCDIPQPNVVCKRVRTRGHGGLFDQTVIIPDALAECYLQRGPDEHMLDESCYPLVQSFLSAYSEPNTLFQMKPKLCFHQYLYTNFSTTAAWFSDKYWTRDAIADQNGTEARSTRRDIKLDPNRVHIALHIRRGDFFNYTNRVLIPDATYADMVGRIKVALDEMVGSNTPITVHVFSEGVPSNERLKDNHDISSMRKIYVNEHGEHMPDNHWQKLLRKSPRIRRLADVQVEMHVASDTIEALHDMLAADFFVGSISGLSMQVVRNIARGLRLLPLHEIKVLEEEFLVPFDYQRNGVPSFVNESLLYHMIAVYARRNRLACSVW